MLLSFQLVRCAFLFVCIYIFTYFDFKFVLYFLKAPLHRTLTKILLWFFKLPLCLEIYDYILTVIDFVTMLALQKTALNAFIYLYIFD